MTTFTTYLKRLKRLQQKAGLKLDVSVTADQMLINNIAFIKVTHGSIRSQENSGKGILIGALTAEERQYCEHGRISYYDLKDNFQLVGPDYVIRLQPSKKITVKRVPKPESPSAHIIDPRLLITPNGFKILDALFKVSDQELSSYRSALSFAHRYDVNQPKLSKITRSLRARDLSELKDQIRRLPAKWWTTALTTQITRKGLSPFFKNAKPHYSLLNLTSSQMKYELKDWDSSNRGLIPGPLSIGESLGFLRDEDISYWGSKESLQKLKTQFKLIPGVNKEKPVWHLATPKFGLKEEAIITQIPQDENSRAKQRLPDSNSFRAVWDLGFGTERLKELQLLILERLVNEF